jgi:hypothetical protein
MSVIRATTVKQFFTHNLALKLLCLALAVSVWLLSSTGRKMQVELQLPLKVVDIPAGFVLNSPPPALITYTLSGPSILVNGALRSNQQLKLSMAGAAASGSTLFKNLDSHLKLPEGVTVTRISPAVLELHLEARHTPAGGQHP